MNSGFSALPSRAEGARPRQRNVSLEHMHIYICISLFRNRLAESISPVFQVVGPKPKLTEPQHSKR